MNLKLAYIENDQKILLKSFIYGNENRQSNEEMEQIQIEELKNLNIQGVFFNDEVLTERSDNGLTEGQEGQGQQDLQDVATTSNHVNWEQLFSEQATSFPIVAASVFHLDEENFSNLNQDQALSIFGKTYSTWILKNNLSTIENIFSVTEHLRKLWKEDPDQFFIQLWQTLKMNLGAEHLRIIYNDVQKAEKEGERDKLIHSYVHGERSPQTKIGGNVEKQLLESFSKDLGAATIKINSYEKEAGELSLSARIGHSPILIMAKAPQFSELQKTLLKGLFNGLQ